MLNRLCFAALLSACLAGSLTGCNSTSLPNGLTVTPSTATITGAGSTVQLSASGQYGSTGHHTYQDVTDQVTWTSGTTGVATVNSSGLVTAVSAGSSQITASISGYGGTLTASSTVTVNTSGGTGGGTGDVTSLTFVPSTLSVAAPSQTAQFTVIGNISGGGSVNVNGKVAWSSSSASIATVNASTGLVTGVGQGTATITGIYTNADNTVATGTGTFTVQNSATQGYSALTILPSSQSATYQTQQSQFTALGTKASNNEQYDITSLVTWASSNTTVATIGSLGSANPGLATAVGTGTTTITATYLNADGSEVVAQATYGVSIGPAQEPLISISIVPGDITVSNIGQTGQYLAYGKFSTTPTVRDLTDYVQWFSLAPDVASVNTNSTTGGQITATTGSTPQSGSNNEYNFAGLVTAEGYTGGSIIYAEATNPDGTVVYSNEQTFTCKDPTLPIPACNQNYAPSQFVTITVFNAGPNETTWSITAPSDTGTADLIHCGPGWTGSGGSVCTGVYAYNPTQTIVLTETSTANSFGGWNLGSNCAEASVYSTTCTVTLDHNQSVGAIFY